MTHLAPHGGCNWEGCEECFPARTESRRVTSATLSTANWVATRVTVVGWSQPFETPIPGYTKVTNTHGIVYVVENSRLTDFRTW